MANGLKYGYQDIDALKFDAPIVEPKEHESHIRIRCSSYNFSSNWTVNPEQSNCDIVVNGDTIDIYSFKPNVWIVKSAYSDTTTKEDFLSKFYGVNWELSLLTEHNSYLSSVTSYGAYKPIGVVLSPISGSNTLMTLDGGLNWPISEGCLKDVVGAVNYGFTSNGKKALYKCSDYFINDGGTPDHLYSSSYPQMALTIFTANETGQDGILRIIDTKAIVDPTTIEGYRAALGNAQLYEKEMTYENVLTKHKLSFKEVGTFTETVDGKSVAITSHYGNEQNTAFVISTRTYDSQYSHIRLPAITNLGTLIQQSFPFKFWAKLEMDREHTHIWDSIRIAFYSNYITDSTFANHLFSNSSGDIENLTLKFDMPSNEVSIDMMGIFDCSNLVNNVHFNINKGVVFSLVHAFKQTHTLRSVDFNKKIYVSDWQGAFEATALENFPTNVFAGDRWHEETVLSGPDCKISDTADAASLKYFGNWAGGSSSGGIVKATVTPAAFGTSMDVGTVTLNTTVSPTQKVTLYAQVCPEVTVPSYNPGISEIYRLVPFPDVYSSFDLDENIVCLLQGIGYDANNNKIAATPTYISSKWSTKEEFDPTQMFSQAGYTPDPLNTSFVGVDDVEFVTTRPTNGIYYMEDDAYKGHISGTAFLHNYIELALTAPGLQKMDIKMRMFTVKDTYTSLSPSTWEYSFGSYISTPYLYTLYGDARHAATSWHITGRASVIVDEDNMTVNPYCMNAFDRSAITEIRYILDMKYVEPAAGGISANGGGFPVFGTSGLVTAYIRNLNKGNWSLDGEARSDGHDNTACGGNLASLSEECANYLLENVFDLRRNLKQADRIENEYNSFNGWDISGPTAWKRPVAFYANGTASLSKTTSTAGNLVVNVAYSDCNVTVKLGSAAATTLPQGKNKINVRYSNGDTILISVIPTGDNPIASIEIDEPFMYELTSGFYSSNLYLPASWGAGERNIIHTDSLAEAEDRGWNVYVGGVKVTTRPET